jgi:hypothetical protein
MACGCGKKTKYVVTTKDGKQTTVDSLTAAMSEVRKNPGATYTRIKV